MLGELCQRCGLCCGGSLFTFLPVTADEAARIAPLGVRLEQRRDGRTAMLLPCAVLRGARCGAYELRPARCREFVCQLGRALERGERSMEAAVTVVDEAKRQLGELEALLGPAAGAEVRGVMQRAQQYEATEPDDAKQRELRLRARELEAMLQHYFVGPTR